MVGNVGVLGVGVFGEIVVVGVCVVVDCEIFDGLE